MTLPPLVKNSADAHAQRCPPQICNSGYGPGNRGGNHGGTQRSCPPQYLKWGHRLKINDEYCYMLSEKRHFMRNMVKSLESLARYAHTVFSMPFRINLRPMRASNGFLNRLIRCKNEFPDEWKYFERDRIRSE